MQQKMLATISLTLPTGLWVTLFPKLARMYDFKIRVLYISKWFFLRSELCW